MKNTENPLVSVIIPCYNYANYIEECINSAINQTYENIEIIVIDNGSTDESLTVIKGFSNNSKVRIFEFKNNVPPGKKGSVIGYAINKSKGDYISILYADDWYLPDKIEKQIELFKRVPVSVGVVYSHGYRYFESTKELIEWKMQSVRGYVFKNYLLNGDIVIPISPLVKKYCYCIIGIDNEWTGSEYDFFVMSKYVDFDYVDDFLVVMRDHQANEGKNLYASYDRVQRYNNEFLHSDSTISRVGSVMINRRLVNNLLIFAMNFISILDKKNTKDAIYKILSISPVYIFKWRVFACLVLIFLPKFLIRKILLKARI